MRQFWRLSLLAFLFGSLVSPAWPDDWLRFRGPNGSGVAAEQATVPASWSPEQNLKWKTPLPGPGSSSPIVVGDRVFVTCWSGYGVDRGNPGDQSNLKRHLLCIDRKTGATLWSNEIAAYLPEDEYGGMFAEHGYASHTPVSDGENVYLFFGKSGVYAFDLNGRQLWHRMVGTESDPRGWGSASSPILYGDTLIVTAAAECQALIGLDKNTGDELWRREARGFGGTWGTPVLVQVDDARTDLVLGVPYEIWGFNPETGKLRWYVSAMDTDSYCSSVVTDGRIVYGIEGRNGGSIAVKAGGEGDVTGSHIVWSGNERARIATPVLDQGRLFYFSGSTVSCLDAATGKSLYQARLQSGGAATESAAPRGPGGGRPGGFGGRGGGGGMGGQDYASPVLADGKIFFQSRSGNMYVLKPGDKFEQLAVNRVTTETEDFSATPAVSNGDLFIRSSRHLYCVGEMP